MMVTISLLVAAVGDRAESRSAVDGADSTYHASNGRARPGSVV